MNIFYKVTLSSLKRNKTRTAVTVIGIILSAAMICAVTTFVSSFHNFVIENEIYTEGNWHGRVTGTDSFTYSEIKSAEQAEDAFLCNSSATRTVIQPTNTSRTFTCWAHRRAQKTQCRYI